MGYTKCYIYLPTEDINLIKKDILKRNILEPKGKRITLNQAIESIVKTYVEIIENGNQED